MARKNLFHNASVGVFDSGIGGLTVVKELLQRGEPKEIHYFGDTARVPYGGKSASTIQRYAFEIAEFLLEKGVDLLLVACNTVSALALEELQKQFSLPVLGVIDPAVSLVEKNGWKKIAVIGTKATIASSAYAKSFLKRFSDLEIKELATPLFVPYIEEGMCSSASFQLLLDEYLSCLKTQFQPEALFLGCTHYPLIRDQIQSYLSQKVAVVDSARALVEELIPQGSVRPFCDWSSCFCYVSDDPKHFTSLAQQMLGAQEMRVERIDLCSTLKL